MPNYNDSLFFIKNFSTVHQFVYKWATYLLYNYNSLPNLRLTYLKLSVDIHFVINKSHILTFFVNII